VSKVKFEKSYILLKSGNAREYGHFRDFGDYRTFTIIATSIEGEYALIADNTFTSSVFIL